MLNYNKQQNTHTVQEIVAAVTNANGMIFLAAERLGMSSDDVLISLATDPTALEQLSVFFRVKMLLDTYQHLQLVTTTVLDQMATSSYSDDIKCMVALSDLFTELSRQAPGTPLVNVNMYERTMSFLPKPVRDAILTVIDEDKVQPRDDDPYALPSVSSQPPKGRPRLLPSKDDDDE